MKKLRVLILCLFFANILYAQDQQAIRITNQTKQKEFLIKETKRIIVEITEGKKFSGRFSAAGNTITIDNGKLEIADIVYLKRNTHFNSRRIVVDNHNRTSIPFPKKPKKQRYLD